MMVFRMYPAHVRKKKEGASSEDHQLAGKKEGCIRRESNPSQLLGRQLSYRWTTEAITAKLENFAFLIQQYAHSLRERYVETVSQGTQSILK
jgi:hypothetical protein